MRLSLALRPYGFALSRPLTTASGSWQQRDGWLLRIVCPNTGREGWGEVAPLQPQERQACEHYSHMLSYVAVYCWLSSTHITVGKLRLYHN